MKTHAILFCSIGQRLIIHQDIQKVKLKNWTYYKDTNIINGYSTLSVQIKNNIIFET
jgi:hypothetical protein